MLPELHGILGLLEGGFAGIRVLVVGDLMLDRYILGEVERISPEAPVPVIRHAQRYERPGGAANVAANLAGLAECTYANCVREQLGDKIPLIVDGGPTGRTQATTIVDLSGGGNSWMILREGAIPTHEIALTLQR